MQRKLAATLITLLVVVMGSLGATLAFGDTPALGLDLQGGISVTQQPVGAFESETLDLAAERIRDRVDSLGVAEPEILRQGDAIVVNLPGVKNQQEAIELVQVTGQVYLRPVQGCIADSGTTTESTESPVPASTDATATTAASATTAAPGPSRRVNSTPTTEAPTTTEASADTTSPATTTADTTDTEPSASTSVPADGSTESTLAPITTSDQVLSDPTTQQLLPLREGGQCLVGPAAGTGEVFDNDASATVIGGGWGATLGLRDGPRGPAVWDQTASECYSGGSSCPSRQLAIELDGEIISAPTVNQPEFTTNVQITGNFTESEAKNLANVLKSGSLGVTMQTQSVQTVSPPLGKDSLHAAIISGLIGVGLVLLLLAFYYRALGLIVAGGLVVSSSILYVIVAFLSRTQGLALSLAGVAGIIVSVGVTVDSYVVFFERLKDEVRAGRTLRNSAQRGFAGAWRTILVADIVSLIGAITLWWLTVGSVRNFAFFLGLSTLVDLVVSYFFTRPAVLLLSRTEFMAKPGRSGSQPAASTAARSAS